MEYSRREWKDGLGLIWGESGRMDEDSRRVKGWIWVLKKIKNRWVLDKRVKVRMRTRIEIERLDEYSNGERKDVWVLKKRGKGETKTQGESERMNDFSWRELKDGWVFKERERREWVLRRKGKDRWGLKERKQRWMRTQGELAKNGWVLKKELKGIMTIGKIENGWELIKHGLPIGKVNTIVVFELIS